MIISPLRPSRTKEKMKSQKFVKGVGFWGKEYVVVSFSDVCSIASLQEGLVYIKAFACNKLIWSSGVDTVSKTVWQDWG